MIRDKDEVYSYKGVIGYRRAFEGWVYGNMRTKGCREDGPIDDPKGAHDSIPHMKKVTEGLPLQLEPLPVDPVEGPSGDCRSSTCKTGHD